MSDLFFFLYKNFHSPFQRVLRFSSRTCVASCSLGSGGRQRVRHADVRHSGTAREQGKQASPAFGSQRSDALVQDSFTWRRTSKPSNTQELEQRATKKKKKKKRSDVTPDPGGHRPHQQRKHNVNYLHLHLHSQHTCKKPCGACDTNLF